MRQMQAVVLSLVSVVILAGCRTATRVVDVPRVDLEVTPSGNRGYLVGQAPPAAPGKRTRQIVQTDIELPGLSNAPQTSGPLRIGGTSPKTEGRAGALGKATARGPYDTYVVQKGESLWTIAAKPEVYGKASAWKRLFDANRDILNSPDRVRAGMTLKVPRGASGDGATSDDEGTTFKK